MKVAFFGFLMKFVVFFLSLIPTTHYLLAAQTPTSSWVKTVFYIVLFLASVGFLVVIASQIKSFFNKDNQLNKEKTWESLWTVVPLIVLFLIWWFF